MFLLLAGSTETARALIVDEFLCAHDDWRHLALEDIENTDMEEGMDEEDIFNFQKSFMTMVACECAKDARDAGHHIIITCPDNEMIEGVYGEIEEPITSVYLGHEDEADAFDHVVNSADKSMVEVCKLLEDIIQAMPA